LAVAVLELAALVGSGVVGAALTGLAAKVLAAGGTEDSSKAPSRMIVVGVGDLVAALSVLVAGFCVFDAAFSLFDAVLSACGARLAASPTTAGLLVAISGMVMFDKSNSSAAAVTGSPANCSTLGLPASLRARMLAVTKAMINRINTTPLDQCSHQLRPAAAAGCVALDCDVFDCELWAGGGPTTLTAGKLTVAAAPAAAALATAERSTIGGGMGGDWTESSAATFSIAGAAMMIGRRNRTGACSALTPRAATEGRVLRRSLSVFRAGVACGMVVLPCANVSQQPAIATDPSAAPAGSIP